MRNLLSHRTKTITAYVLLLAIFTASPLYAVESTIVVELQKRIRNNITELHDTRKSMEETTSNLNQETENISQEFSQTADRNDKRYLVRRMLGVHANSLKETATSSVQMQSTLESLVDNMEQLQESLATSNSSGLSSASQSDMASISNVMQGMEGMYKQIAKMNPNNEQLAQLATKLNYQNAYYVDFFKQNKDFSIEKQIEHLMNLHASLEAGLKLIDRERLTLQYAANSILKGELEDNIFQIDVNIAPIYKSIMGGHQKLFSMIDQVNNSGRASRKKSAPMEVNGLGIYGK